ncbi:MAG: hypothetical protein L6R28_25505, partial [Planctomycetes bacterium]|nr:hypothetical protein [Planctomycetota bacterium]
MRLARLHPAILALCVVLGGLATGKTAHAAGWVSPTGHSDPENKWTSEANSYDGSTSTYASDTSNRIGYGAWINFTLATPILSDRVRVNADFGYGVVNKVDIDVKRDGQWVDVWEGAVADAQYTEKTFTAGTVSEIRFRFN